MSWIASLAGVGVTAGLGVASLNAQKKQADKAAKLAEQQTQALTRAGIVLAVVVGFVLVVKVYRG